MIEWFVYINNKLDKLKNRYSDLDKYKNANFLKYRHNYDILAD